MLSIINKFADYLFTEDTRIPYNSTLPGSPLLKDDLAPNFSITTKGAVIKNHYGVKDRNGTVSLKQLLNKPLAIAFYSAQWNQNGIDFLKTVNTIQNEINLLGGQLIILSADNHKTLEKIADAYQLTLNIYSDPQNDVAAKFGVFSEERPLWEHISGINSNISFLSLYVVAPDRKITLSYIDNNLAGDLSVKEILSAVFEASVYNKS